MRVKLLSQVDERRQPRSKATLGVLIDRWLEVVDLDLTTRAGYLGKIEKHIRPTLGHLPLAKIDAELLEHFYARLRRCRGQCSGRPTRGHTCQPLAPSTVRQIHRILSGALGRAVRWRWIAVNSATQAEPPGLTPAEPGTTVRKGRGPDPHGGVGEGPGLGLVPLAGHDDRCASRRAARAAVAARRPRGRCADDRHGRRAGRGYAGDQGHEDTPEASDRAGRRDGGAGLHSRHSFPAPASSDGTAGSGRP